MSWNLKFQPYFKETYSQLNDKAKEKVKYHIMNVMAKNPYHNFGIVENPEWRKFGIKYTKIKAPEYGHGGIRVFFLIDEGSNKLTFLYVDPRNDDSYKIGTLKELVEGIDSEALEEDDDIL